MSQGEKVDLYLKKLQTSENGPVCSKEYRRGKENNLGLDEQKET